MRFVALYFLLGSFLTYVTGQEPLEEYNVNVNEVSVSGLSSGAAMATQFHVAYSEFVLGVGLVAGLPYYCARGNIAFTDQCMERPENVDISTLISQTTTYENSGLVSAVSNMRGDKVAILHGALDSTVLPGSASKIREYYDNFDADISLEFLEAEHTQPTVDNGEPCTYNGGEYIGRCNFNAAYHVLNHIYGNLIEPGTSVPLPGRFYIFDQREFFYTTTPSWWSMSDEGYVYVPSGCVSGQECKLHVAFHGCRQNTEYVGDSYATKSGYNEVGELNNIIILYPQTIMSANNPRACWDWWAYNLQANYATKEGGQILAVCRMVERVTGDTVCLEV